MNCLSWNVRGLEAPDRKFVIKQLLNSLHSIDFFMMQEVKSVGFTLDSNLNFIWKDAIKFCTTMREVEEELPCLLVINGKNILLIMDVLLVRERCGLLCNMMTKPLGSVLFMLQMTLKKELSSGIGLLTSQICLGFSVEIST